MAEFQEVMKQAKRMCKTVGACGKCPLRTMEHECRFASVINADFGPDGAKAIERIVMEWAEKHPEPKYPTWKEWQDTNFPNNDALMRPCIFESEEYFNCKSENGCENCMNKPIPPDIAEKLGVKPIGGVDDENA